MSALWETIYNTVRIKCYCYTTLARKRTQNANVVLVLSAHCWLLLSILCPRLRHKLNENEMSSQNAYVRIRIRNAFKTASERIPAKHRITIHIHKHTGPFFNCNLTHSAATFPLGGRGSKEEIIQMSGACGDLYGTQSSSLYSAAIVRVS